jgi:hypothetical protein
MIECISFGLPPHPPLRDIELRFVGKACGKRGADVRPYFEPAKMGTIAKAAPSSSSP